MFRRVIQIACLAVFAWLFFHVCCPYPAEPVLEPRGVPSHYADSLTHKERLLPAETFLMLDPTVALAASIAERHWNSCIIGAVLVIVICLLVPRGFCGYVCPLGTMIDLTDKMLGKVTGKLRRFVFPRKTTRRPLADSHAVLWRHFKYVLLGVTFAAAICGVSLAGYVAPIPMVTRAFVFLFAPIQTAWYCGWYQVPPPNAGVMISVMLFAGILLLGLLQRRFWCRYLCPSGALLSLVGLVRVFGRKVDMQKCNGCSRCVTSCTFAAIPSDNISVSLTDCVTCLECKSLCPQGAISFGLNNQASDTAVPIVVPELTWQRRRFFQVMLFGITGFFSILIVRAWNAFTNPHDNLIRPPGSVPEEIFLKRCVRCGECLHACPNDALQPCAMEFGETRMWTPRLMPDWSGCEPSCNNCGRVCPTGAIRALPLEEKRACIIGLAVIDRETCLPLAGKEECRLCYDECKTAGYDAIEFMRVGTEVDESGMPIEDSGFLAPVILPEKCVGCGLCQTRCRAINAVQKKLLRESAIVVIVGEGREDRILTGSYRDLRKKEKTNNIALPETPEDDYLPDFLQ